MIADNLLSRLDKVRQKGVGQWTALCPAHEDKSPSLAIREAEDGRVLVHCFAGCGTDEVLGAVGLDFDALFPEKPIEHAPRFRRPFNAHDVLESLAFESLVIVNTSCMMRNGETLSDEAHERLLLAAGRIQAGRSLADG